MRLPALALFLATLSASPTLAADGAKTFLLQCKSCHGAKSSLMGPTLTGVAGAKIAGRSDFAYSTGLKARAGTWSDANLEAYLTAPTKFAPGSRMPQGVANPADRAAVIGYLKTLK